MLISVYYSNPVCQLSQVESSANYGYLTDYYYNAGNLYKQRLSVILLRFTVTVHIPLSREVFWHEYAKIPRHTSQNAITEGDFKCILARNCEGTEQLHENEKKRGLSNGQIIVWGGIL